MKEFDFKVHGIDPNDSWSSLVLVRTYKPDSVPVELDEDTDITAKYARGIPTGFIFVIERMKFDPKWKLPGGHKQPGETPLETAIRELHGETGLLVPANQMSYVGKWRRQKRGQSDWWWDCMFVAAIAEDEQCWMNQLHSENEGEQPKFFTVDAFRELLRTSEFLLKHVHMLDEKSLILWME